MEGERGRGGGTPDTSPQRARNEPHNFGPFSVQGPASRMSQRIRYTAGSRVPGVRKVCAFRSSVKSEVGVTGRVRTRHISPRQSPSHPARARPAPPRPGATRPAARGPSFSPLAHLLRPPSSPPFLLPVCQTSAFLPSFTERAHASVNAETKMEILECPFSDSTLHSNLPFPLPALLAPPT